MRNSPPGASAHRHRRLAPRGAATAVVLAVLIAAVATESTRSGAAIEAPRLTQESTGSGCPQFVTEPSAAQAFCATFAQADPTPGTRSGALNGVLWGVSHATSADNQSQGKFYDWAASTQDQCGSEVQVAPDGDVNDCGGQLVESANDSGYQTVLG